jgi:fatty-acyl-CoA synthase
MGWDSLTIGEALRRSAARSPTREAVIDGEQRLSFAELDRRSDATASALLARGVRHGDRVAVWIANSAEFVVLWMACARIGAVLVPINTRLKIDEVRYVLEQSGACVLVMMDRRWGIDFLAVLHALLPECAQAAGRIESAAFPELHTVVLWGEASVPGTLALDALGASAIDRAALDAAGSRVRSDDTVIIVYTSGTTGRPKGAMHSHVMLRNAANVARVMHIEPGERILGHMPFYHIAGTLTEILPCVLLGCTLVTMPKWDAEAALALIERERVNFFGGIPTHFIDCIDVLKHSRYDTSCLKSAWIGGAPVTPDVARAAFASMRLDALQAVYGMTETTSSTVLSEFDAPLEVLCDNKGKPIGEFEVVVVDPVTERPAPVDAVGEIRVRGHIVMQGYFRNPEATREVMTADGFFKTGDLGCFDGQGYLKVTGRVKDMFIVGGTNAYPAEIERMLQLHAGIKQAIVVGVPHRRLGEVGFAFVQPETPDSLDEAALHAYCQHTMADYKVPRHFQFVSEFPLTPTGKIQRYVLAERARAISAERSDEAGLG